MVYVVVKSLGTVYLCLSLIFYTCDQVSAVSSLTRVTSCTGVPPPGERGRGLPLGLGLHGSCLCLASQIPKTLWGLADSSSLASAKRSHRLLSGYGLLCFKFFVYIYLKGSETESFHLLVHSPDAYNSQGWTRPTSGPRNSIQISHVEVGTQAIASCLPGCILAGSCYQNQSPCYGRRHPWDV